MSQFLPPLYIKELYLEVGKERERERKKKQLPPSGILPNFQNDSGVARIGTSSVLQVSRVSRRNLVTFVILTISQVLHEHLLGLRIQSNVLNPGNPMWDVSSLTGVLTSGLTTRPKDHFYLETLLTCKYLTKRTFQKANVKISLAKCKENEKKKACNHFHNTYSVKILKNLHNFKNSLVVISFLPNSCIFWPAPKWNVCTFAVLCFYCVGVLNFYFTWI